MAFGGDIILHHANSMTTDLSGGGTKVSLYGAVFLSHEGRDLRSSSAFWDKNVGQIRFIGNVALTDTLQRIFTDTLFYRRDDKFAHGKGNVRYERLDSSLVITGGDGTYNGIAEILTMILSPHLVSVDTTDSTVIELDANKFIYEVLAERGTAIDSALVVIHEKDTTKPPVYIRADSIVFYPRRDEVYAFGAVEVRQEATLATADSIRYHRKADRIEMLGNPILKQDNNRLVGDRFTLELKKGKLTRMWVYGPSDGTKPPMGFWRPQEDSLETLPESWFTSKSMAFEFEDGKLRIAHLIREATTEYHPWPENQQKRENNRTSGDSIAVWFAKEGLDSIEVHRAGTGRYVLEEFDSDSLSKIAKRDSMVYSGDFLALSREGQTVAIQGSGAVRYKDMGLDAGRILYNFDTDILIAEPIYADDSLIGRPSLFDKNETMTGNKITYNINTRRGRMIQANSAVDLGYYRGGVVHKSAGDTLFIAKSHFIPCECESALTHFVSDRAKLIPKDKAVARNIVLYIGKVPIFGVPFFVFPIQSGRRSGLLTFDIGQFQKGQRYVRNIGYYWAPNDFWDIQTGFDYNEESGLVLRGKTHYALRYRLSGNISASYELERRRDFLETTGSDRWSLSGSHIQNLWPRASLTGSASFVSDVDYLTDIEYDPQTSMQRNLTSNLAFSQNQDWGSISANIERSENLISRRTTTYLPRLRVSKYSRPLFKPDSELNRKFYHNLTLSVSGLAVHYRLSDTLNSETHTGLQANTGASLPFSLGPYLSLTPSSNAQFALIDMGADSSNWPSRLTYGASVNATTNLYGRFPLNGFLGVKTFKHDIAPTTTFNWSPEFSDASHFYSFGGISPGGSSKRQSLSYGLRQDFSFETREDSLRQSKKIQIATLNTNGSYDFLSETRNFSDITTSVRTSPFKWLSLTGGLSHSLYPEGSTEIGGLRLLSRNLTTEFAYRGNFAYGDSVAKVSRDYRVTLSHYLADNYTGSVTHWIKGNISVYPTANWRVEYSNYFDIQQGKTVSEEIRLWRDLGCWEGMLVWVPSGYRKGWYFRVNIKKIPDIKVEGSHGRAK
jgi:lipopolysaccharide assembly outer membrane protein LptD (OstA)